MDIGALRDKLAAYLPAQKLSAVDAAHRYSESAHSGQTRASGKPYILHPLTVADILADWHADAPSIIAALLHDVVEDTPITLEQIQDTFGEEIANLVDGLSKIERLQGIDRDMRDAENFRKLLLAAAADWRVVFIKLADRLHNMRTLSAIGCPQRRRQIAGETVDLYAPIAQRLGIHKVQEELQNLCFRHLHPHRFRVLSKAIKKSGENSRAAIDGIEHTLHDGMRRHGLQVTMKKRKKNLYSIYKKMERANLSFAEVEDILGFRIIAGDRAACYQTLGVLHELFTPLPHRFRDFIALPKENGYQSLHTGLISKGGVKIDVQIRTAEMDEIAEHGLAAHWRYKQPGVEAAMDATQARALRQLSSLVQLHAENPVPAEFMENIKIDLFPAEMLVITPKGKVVTLPRGATALDMAYAIHTEIGDHAERAVVNGKPLPLSMPLNSGDQVEILTNPAVAPLPHWLTSAKTARARSRIRHVLQETAEHESASIGRNLLVAEIRRLAEGVALEDIEDSHWRTVLGGNGFKSKEALYRALGLGKMMPEVVARALLRRRVRSSGDSSPMQPILIAGAGRSAIHLSPCCHPLPMEPIVGVLRKERGLVVHSGDCPAVRGSSRRSERWTEVQWSLDAATRHHRSMIHLHCRNYPGLISSVSSRISAQGINIVTCHFDGGASDRQSILLEMMVEVRTLAELQQLLAHLTKIPEVLAAERKRGGST